MKVYNLKKQYYALADEPFAKGGEGSIFDLVDTVEYVAKIYHANGRTSEREDKIKTMLNNPPKGMSGRIAWPSDIVYAKNGMFLGFIMPRIKNVTKIDSLYSYDNRDTHNYSFYLQVAQNLCAAVDSVHKSGHVCGDLNPANICVDPKTAYVTIVDTDSYHINAGDGNFFRCPVCRPEYVPVEIQRIIDTGISLRDTNSPTFSVYTDYFAVAIHVFALLMNGAHPYSCAVSDGMSASSFNIVGNIERGVFAFSPNKYGVSAPKYSPSFGSLPKEMQEMFYMAFSAKTLNKPHMRPTLTRMHTVLEQFEQTLTTCSLKPVHQYCNINNSCPLCEAESRTHAISSTPPPVLVVKNTTATTTTANPTHTRRTARPATSGGADTFAFILGVVAALALFAGALLFLTSASQSLFMGSIWGMIPMIISIGVIPFIPLWIVAIVDNFACFTSAFFCGVAATLNKSLYLSYAAYIGTVIFTFQGSIFDILINGFLICIPTTIVAKVFPGLTQDLL